MFSDSAGGSSSSRASLRVPLGVLTSRVRRRPSTRPRTSIGPVPGSSENSKACSANALVDVRGGADRRRRRRAEQRHLQPAVLLEIEPLAVRHGLADGEADLLAAVVDAAPDRARSRSARGRWRGCRRLEIRPVDQHRHHGDPADHQQDRNRAGDRPGQRSEERAHVPVWLSAHHTAGTRYWALQRLACLGAAS